eukprot:GEZU01002763.1.p1 GENE.GEZU01002763.1~~GEZU01002763.1.p1  ORF type:complete len:123 (-),score=17.18 GEZU01002763.1:52-420(-)
MDASNNKPLFALPSALPPRAPTTSLTPASVARSSFLPMGNTASTPMAPNNYKAYSLDEIATHNKEDDCWTIVHGKVYDITKYLDEHPGGKRLLFQNAGMNSHFRITFAFRIIIISDRSSLDE